MQLVPKVLLVSALSNMDLRPKLAPAMIVSLQCVSEEAAHLQMLCYPIGSYAGCDIMQYVVTAQEQQHSSGVKPHGCGDAAQSTKALQMGKHAPGCAEPPCHAPFCLPSTDEQCSSAPMHKEGLSYLHSREEHGLHRTKTAAQSVLSGCRSRVWCTQLVVAKSMTWAAESV